MRNTKIIAASVLLFISSNFLVINCFARNVVFKPTFSEDQLQVISLVEQEADLESRVAWLVGTSKIRLMSMETFYVPYLIAQYMTYLEIQRSDNPEYVKQSVREILGDQEWTVKVVKPLLDEAKLKNMDLCDVRLAYAKCLYYIVSKDMNVRAKILSNNENNSNRANSENSISSVKPVVDSANKSLKSHPSGAGTPLRGAP